MQNLLEFIKKLQSDKRFTSFDEAATKQGIVLKILSLLEWDPFNIDEIQPEYAMGDKRVDFSLRSNNSNKAFVVVEKVAKKEVRFHGYGLMDFAAKEGVKTAILTNGITWWFFSQHIGDEFSGKAAKAAENIYQAKQNAILMKEHLPKAWQEIMKEPEKWLVDIVVKVTEGLCGHKPDKETVKNFLSSDIEIKSKIPTLIKPEPTSKPQEEKKSAQKSYTGKSINAFTFKGKKYMVKSLKAILLKVCELINVEHKDNFEFLISLSTQERDVFSKDKDRILISEKIPGTDIYVNVDLTPKDTLALCYEVMSAFGYKESDLSIEAK